jgi:hypothetical protein
MESDQRMIIRFLYKDVSRPKIFGHGVRHNLEKRIRAWVVSNGGASMFGKETKTQAARCDPAWR